jgi:hypothetical protein
MRWGFFAAGRDLGGYIVWDCLARRTQLIA